jgi:hypothetical protein
LDPAVERTENARAALRHTRSCYTVWQLNESST